MEKSSLLFEVSDHLGNVRAVVSGQKVTVADIPSYQYHFGFESAQDAPDQYWDSWVFSKDEKYSGEQSVYVTGFGHSAYVPVEPGDTISAEAMMKFVSGTQGGFIYMALQDENGQNEIGRRSDQVDAGAHQNINTWSRIYQSDVVVPAGKYRLYFYLRVNTSAGNSPSWFDDFKVTVRGKNARTVEVADIITLTDYYAFGMAMPGRTICNSEQYRYGFNGMEKDDDWYGENDAYDFGARMYDSRTGRWQSRDPLAEKYPYLSPYVGMGNRPTVFVDRDGRDTWFYTTSGKFLGRVADDLPHAITIVSEIGLVGPHGLKFSYNPYVDPSEARQNASLVMRARMQGHTYLFEGMENLFERSVKSGKEHANWFIENVYGWLTVSDEGDNIGSSGNSVNLTHYGFGYSECSEVLSKFKADIHSHPLSSNTPSVNDIVTRQGHVKTGYMSAVVNQTEYVFYYSAKAEMKSPDPAKPTYGNMFNDNYNVWTRDLADKNISAYANYNIRFKKSYLAVKSVSNKAGNKKVPAVKKSDNVVTGGKNKR